MQESAAWQHGASQAALDSIVWLDNHSSEPSGVSIPGQEGRCLSEDDMTSNSGTDVFSSPAAMLPLSRDFLDGVRHWPSRDHFGNTPDV